MQAVELFDMKGRLDRLEKENGRLRKENEELKAGQVAIQSKVSGLVLSQDDQDQVKLKDELLVTGTLLWSLWIAPLFQHF